jgi:hypothetical protein
LWTRSVLVFDIYTIKACNILPFHSVYFSCPLLLYYTKKYTSRHNVSTEALQCDSL